MDFGERVSRLSEQREAARCVGDRTAVERLTRELDRLYAEKRLRVAQNHHGSNAQIVKRARIETELERLMSRNGSKRGSA